MPGMGLFNDEHGVVFAKTKNTYEDILLRYRRYALFVFEIC